MSVKLLAAGRRDTHRVIAIVWMVINGERTDTRTPTHARSPARPPAQTRAVADSGAALAYAVAFPRR